MWSRNHCCNNCCFSNYHPHYFFYQQQPPPPSPQALWTRLLRKNNFWINCFFISWHAWSLGLGFRCQMSVAAAFIVIILMSWMLLCKFTVNRKITDYISLSFIIRNWHIFSFFESSWSLMCSDEALYHLNDEIQKRNMLEFFFKVGSA